MGKRFVTDFQSSRSDQEIQYIVNDYLSKEGFEYTQYKGELVWKKGMGFATAPQFIKIGFMNGQVHLEAWLKTALLPGVYIGEMGLDGFYGFALKKVLKSRVDTLIGILMQGPAMPPQG